MAKNLTGRNSKRKNRSRTLGARLDRQRGVYIESFWVKAKRRDRKRDEKGLRGGKGTAPRGQVHGPRGPLSFLPRVSVSSSFLVPYDDFHKN